MPALLLRAAMVGVSRLSPHVLPYLHPPFCSPGAPLQCSASPSFVCCRQSVVKGLRRHSFISQSLGRASRPRALRLLCAWSILHRTLPCGVVDAKNIFTGLPAAHVSRLGFRRRERPAGAPYFPMELRAGETPL